MRNEKRISPCRRRRDPHVPESSDRESSGGNGGRGPRNGTECPLNRDGSAIESGAEGIPAGSITLSDTVPRSYA